ncbi:energy transducer TonB [Pedobacter sp. Du54]|uniref:energy transducer TonB n=1 Tax=Pedobacter anseongensis TaxID=3133439 RepID=UPI0030B0EFBD
MKKIIILFFLCFVLGRASAQKKQNVYYFKNNDKEVNTKDSADYIRVIQEPDSGETNFILREFFSNEKRKTTGKVSAFEPYLVYEGVIMRFDKEGKRKEITTYEKGSPLGMSYEYFSNGKMHRQTEYLAFVPQGNSAPFTFTAMGPSNRESKLIYLADSLGVEFVKDGNGYVRNYNVFGKDEQTEEGGYTNGVKHGVWKGSSSASATSFIESYDMGKLVGGESIREGVKYPYTTYGAPPSFKGGIRKFYEYVGYSTKYPSDAAKDRISGTVVLSFAVEKDGSTSEVKVERSVFSSIDEEAKRVVLSSPKWIPGTMRGVPVRVRYSIPLKFSTR